MQMRHGILTEILTNVYSILLTLEAHAIKCSKAFTVVERCSLSEREHSSGLPSPRFALQWRGQREF